MTDALKGALCRIEGHPSDWDDTLDMCEEDVEESPASRKARHARAKEVCFRCPVRGACAEQADVWKDSGIWFGLPLEQFRKEHDGARRAEMIRRRVAADSWSA